MTKISALFLIELLNFRIDCNIYFGLTGVIKKQLIIDKSRQLEQLEETYERCIEDIGEGHRNAIAQDVVCQTVF